MEIVKEARTHAAAPQLVQQLRDRCRQVHGLASSRARSGITLGNPE
jgi:hypothetical protein